jgi:membrane protein DedA with SNARE-associated domain/rhodanese-related sulfurtransferase
MDIAQLSATLRHDAVGIVFANVFLQQIGLPVPAVPTLLLAGSLATGGGTLAQLLQAAALASVFADWIWYGADKLFGYRVLSTLCKLSINPSSCVNQTEARFIRWGLSSLVVAKFIPGFSTVAPPIAGALRMNRIGFLAASAAGAALWAGLAIGIGWLCRDTVQTVILSIDHHAGEAVALLLLALTVWLAWKLWQKFRFRQFSAVPHITPDELLTALASDDPPLVLDLRGATMVAERGPLPGAHGARVAEHDRLDSAIADWPKDRPIVTLCACPQDAGAVQAARQLLNRGYLSVRPLRGGYEAWLAAHAAPAVGN